MCNSNNSCDWVLIIILILIFTGGNLGFGCGNNCGGLFSSGCGCNNNCGCERNNCGCNCCD